MVARIAQLALDVHDLLLQARFWAEALEMMADVGDDGDAMLYPPDEAPKSVQTIYLQGVDEAKRDKVRVRFDLRPEDSDVEREVEGLLGLGATRADVGQTGTRASRYSQITSATSSACSSATRAEDLSQGRFGGMRNRRSCRAIQPG